MTRRRRALAFGLAVFVAFALLAAVGPGLDLAGMDRAVAPGDDFFAFANGAWARRTEIPADRESWGIAGAMAELTQKRVHELVSAAAKGHAPAGSDARKVGDCFAAYMNEAAIEKAGLKPLQPEFDRIAAIGDRAALARYLGGTLRADVDLFNSTDEYTENILGVWIAQDLDDPAHYIPFLVQGGLGLPDRDYYVTDSAHLKAIRGKYLAHVAKMLTLAKMAGAGRAADAKAARIVALETKIAAVHWTLEDTGSVQKGNNRWTRADFPSKAPGLDWDALFDAAGLGTRKTFIVWQPGALTGIAALVAAEPLDSWKEYLAFHALEKRASHLPAAFDREHFSFHSGVIRGIPRQRERWKRALDATDAALGEAVGRMYVERWFPPSEKARAEAMVGHLIAAFRQRIDRLDWMAPETKERAKAKLAVLRVGVGYPDRWRDYSGLTIARNDAFGNALRAELFDYRSRLARLDQPVDRSEWVMTPQTVNAVNLPAMNAMNFPAAILQPPFFDPDRPAAMDYGNTGATIGHEISHSFDDQGALFDADGRLSNWWTDRDMVHFRAVGARLADQFSAYRPFPDVHVNGSMTLGENLADLAGLQAAYDAYVASLGGEPAPVVAGFTGDQQFFLSYAQGWRTKLREAAARQRLITDGHAPPQYRVAIVRNLDPWYAAFDVKPGQPLYLAPEQRVRIW